MSDSGSLADSAYEIIQGIESTDNESQDDRLTESTGSLSVSRPDDVHSLDGSENHYESDSDKEPDDSSRASSIRYADQALQNPSTQQLPTSSLQYGSSTEGSGVVVPSIEFQEGDGDDSSPVLVEKISVKHAIREFSEEESSAMAQRLDLPDAPKRLVATVRQTMSQAYLSTQEPLRVLYVGRADAQRSIVLKICSAIWVSPKNGAKDQDYFNRHREGVYNIVPISSFGPAPELDLMEASHYQIKVEHCTSAQETVYDGGPLQDDIVYSITIEQEKTYKSFLFENASAVQPRWDLPHIAIFYCSERDDTEAERTRDAAWSFMNRHGVPAIFIADRQNFGSRPPGRWEDYIDEHTVHLCLESRDPERPMDPQRFPIDYASFADIDARQMNRHLAFLTGLTESEKMATDLDSVPARDNFETEFQPLECLGRAKSAFAKLGERIDWKWWVLALVAPVVMSLVAPFIFGLFAGSPLSGDSSHPEALDHTNVCVSPLNPGGFTTSKRSSVATSTTTVVINVTSTKTVQVSHAKPSTSTLASALSFAGFLSDKPSAVPADSEIKTPITSPKTVCSVRVYSPTEFLVEIPSRNKAVWLAQGAIDIDVCRGGDLLKTKISSVDEGVLVELGSKDAYGVLNVSVVTTRKPKINETFQVDFGRTAVVEAFEAGLHLLQDGIKKVSSSVNGASHLIEDMRMLSGEAASYLEHASEAVRTQTVGTVNRVTNNARERIARQVESVETFVDLSVLRAQVASTLWWLKMQGKMDEYAEYKRNASLFIKLKHDELLKGQGAQEKGEPKEAWSLFGMRCGSYWKGDCMKGRDARDTDTPGTGRRESRWRKMMGGA